VSDDKDISLKGLDEFSRAFLVGSRPSGEEEYINIQGGQKANTAALAKWEEERKKEFIRRAGLFTEDLVAFVIEQRKIRNLSDEETVFGIALATINLRSAYGSPQGGEKRLTPEQRGALLDRFDTICFHAQQYWDANKD
jgi:hypothetical protein